jgi:hypothetical protein
MRKIMSQLQIGDKVNYHAIIGGPIISTDHIIEKILFEPNNFGCDVAWITGKSGCVALAALSKSNKNGKIKCGDCKYEGKRVCGTHEFWFS